MWKNFKVSLKQLGNHPALIMPLFFVAVLELIWLAICYYMPRPPVSYVLAPLVKAFIGEKFLHYPLNFVILGRLVFIGRIFIYFGVGLVAWAMSVACLCQINLENNNIRLFGNLNRALRYYPALLVPVFIYAFGALAVYKVPRLIIATKFDLSTLKPSFSIPLFIITFLLLILLESILVYVPVAVILKRVKIFSGIRTAWNFFRKHVFSTFFFILAFRSLNAASFFLKNNIPSIIYKYFSRLPEISIWIIVMEIILLFLVNFIILLATTEFFINSRGGEK